MRVNPQKLEDVDLEAIVEEFTAATTETNPQVEGHFDGHYDGGHFDGHYDGPPAPQSTLGGS